MNTECKDKNFYNCKFFLFVNNESLCGALFRPCKQIVPSIKNCTNIPKNDLASYGNIQKEEE
jgi:hypothetical protein